MGYPDDLWADTNATAHLIYEHMGHSFSPDFETRFIGLANQNNEILSALYDLDFSTLQSKSDCNFVFMKFLWFNSLVSIFQLLLTYLRTANLVDDTLSEVAPMVHLTLRAKFSSYTNDYYFINIPEYDEEESQNDYYTISVNIEDSVNQGLYLYETEVGQISENYRSQFFRLHLDLYVPLGLVAGISNEGLGQALNKFTQCVSQTDDDGNPISGYNFNQMFHFKDNKDGDQYVSYWLRSLLPQWFTNLGVK